MTEAQFIRVGSIIAPVPIKKHEKIGVMQLKNITD